MKDRLLASAMLLALAVASCGKSPDAASQLHRVLSATERGAMEAALSKSRLVEHGYCLSRDVTNRVRGYEPPGVMADLTPPVGFEPLVEADVGDTVRLKGRELGGVPLCNHATDIPRVALPVIIEDRELVVIELPATHAAYYMVRQDPRWSVVATRLKIDDI